MKQKRYKMVAKMWDKTFWDKYYTNSIYKNSPWLFVLPGWKQIISEQKYRDNFSKYSEIKWKWVHKETKLEYDKEWYDKYGYNKQWYNKEWLDYYWYDRDWYDKDWYDKYDFDRNWINKDTKTKVDNEWHIRDYYN